MDSLLRWLEEGTHLPAILTLFSSLLSVALYLVLRTVACRRVATHPERRSASLLLVVSILILFVISLLFVWSGYVDVLQTPHDLLSKQGVYQSVIWTLVAIVLVYLLGKALEHALTRSAADIESRHKVRTGVAWGRTFVLIGCVALIWLRDVQQIAFFLGFVGAGVAFALQEPLLCIVGWVLIIVKKPFDIGDRIEVDGTIGDVIDISIFHTTMIEVGNWVEADQSTGRIVSMPNSKACRRSIFNYTKGFPFIWNELKTVVTFESDWKRAKEIILKQAQEEAEKIEAEVRRQITAMQGRYAIRYKRLSPIVYTSIVGHGVALTLRYLSPVRHRRATGHLIAEGILDGFASETNIDFAYLTTRFYRHDREGKPALMPEDNGGAHPEE